MDPIQIGINIIVLAIVILVLALINDYKIRCAYMRSNHLYEKHREQYEKHLKETEHYYISKIEELEKELEICKNEINRLKEQ